MTFGLCERAEAEDANARAAENSTSTGEDTEALDAESTAPATEEVPEAADSSTAGSHGMIEAMVAKQWELIEEAIRNDCRRRAPTLCRTNCR